MAGIQGRPVRLLEGFFEAQTNAAKFRYGPDTQPASTDVGGVISAGAGRGVGPVKDASSGWDLTRLWMANNVAGSNATVIIQGIIEDL